MYSGNHLANALRAASLGHEDQVFAYLPGGGAIDYGTFFAGAERFAVAMRDMGVEPGDRVAAQIKKSIGSLQLYVGTVLAGGVFLPLNTSYTPAEVEYFLSDAEPRLLVCDPERREALQEAADGVGVACVHTLDGAGAGSLADTAARKAGAVSDGFDAVARGPDDLAAILYTSGTTGRSKGAMLSHDNLLSNAAVLRDAWAFTANDVLIHALPIFHTHGLFVGTNITFLAGSSLIFMPGFDGEKIIDAMPRATTMMGVPTFYVRLLEHSKLAEAARGMRLFVSGSAPLLAETHERWRTVTGHAILERYGMTETNMNTSNPYDGERRAGTVGFPLPGVDLRITDPKSGAEVPRGEPGVIEVRGRNVFQGYWRMPEKTAEEFRADGFFVTGDIAVIDDAGYVSIVGRAKDLIITGGYNVYPKEIELMIDDLPGVDESAVVGVAHPDFGEGVVAVVVRDGSVPDDRLDEAGILKAIAPSLARYKQPKRILFADALPRNTMGKVQKNELRASFAGLFGPEHEK